MSATSASILAEFFRAKNIRELAWYGRSSVADATVSYLRESGGLPSGTVTLRNLVEAAFRALRRDYPSEYLFKSSALGRTVFGRYSPKTTSFYTEFPVGPARADVVLVNGNATVIEIKSRFDSVTRLEEQIAAYRRAFAHVTVMIDVNRAVPVWGSLPETVGVTALVSGRSMRELRPATEDRSELTHDDVFALLRKPEYTKIATRCGAVLDGIHPAEHFDVCLEAVRSLPINELHNWLVSCLRKRQRTEKLAKLCSTLPTALHLAVFSYRLRTADWTRIVEHLDGVTVVRG